MMFMHRFPLCLLFFILVMFPAAPTAPLSAQTADPRTMFNQARAHLDAGDYDAAWKLFNQAHELDTANRNYATWLMYVSVFQGQTAVYANDHDTALKYFNTALALKKEQNPDLQAKDGELYTIQRYIDLVREHALYSKIKPEYVHRVRALYIMKTELKDVVDSNGSPVIAKGDISESLIEGTIRYQNMLKFYIETLTKGRVTLSFDRKVVNTTLTRATIYVRNEKHTKYRPDFNSTAESLGPIMFEGRNAYDTTIYYFNNDNFDVMIYAMGVPNIYIPYTWYGPPRGSIGLMLGGKNLPKNPTYTNNFPHIWITFHEFFHVVEWLSGGIRPQHAYLPENMDQAKKNFPEWVPDMNPVWTATEYSWYRYHLHNTVPGRMEQQAARTGLYPPFRNFSFLLTNPDRTEEYVYRTYTAAVKGISLDNLRKAAELLDEAYALRRNKKDDESIETLKKALQYNPCHHRVLIELGWEMVKKKDYAEADRYYGAMAKVYPDPKELFATGKTFFDRSEFALAAKYFGIAAGRPGRNPVYIRWLERALFSAGDRRAGERAMARIETNPVMRSPIAYITNKGAGQALYSAANPEDEAAPGLAAPRQQDGYRWKLVSAGDRDHVMIVSDYSWKCLEARGDGGGYAVVQGDLAPGDAKKWRLDRGPDGLCRLISKTSGTPLAVAMSEDGKKGLLTLKEAGSPYWEVRELDSALNLMESEKTVSIVSAANGRAVDLYSGKTEDGAAVNLWQRIAGHLNQMWKFLPSSADGYVYIVAVKSWKCITAVPEGDRVGILQMSINGDAAQQWKIVPKGAGHLLINRKYGTALEVDPQQPNKLMRLREADGSPGQLWKLEW